MLTRLTNQFDHGTARVAIWQDTLSGQVALRVLTTCCTSPLVVKYDPIGGYCSNCRSNVFLLQVQANAADICLLGPKYSSEYAVRSWLGSWFVESVCNVEIELDNLGYD